MRKHVVALVSLVMMCVFIGACAKDVYERVEMRPSFLEASIDERPYIKRAAFIPMQGSAVPFERQTDALFFQRLVETIRTEADHLELVTPQDRGFPPFLLKNDLFSSADAVSVLMKELRRQGYHYLAQAGVLYAQPFTEKKGFWFFRKERSYINFVVALDIFDTFTGSKIVSKIVDKSVRIAFSEYESMVAGYRGAPAVVDETAVEYGKNLGDLAADMMDSNRWMTEVIAVEGRSVVLAAGRTTGLREGHRLAVFEGRRTVTGLEGVTYVAPGYKLGVITIADSGETNSRAEVDQPIDIRPGDIAVPAP